MDFLSARKLLKGAKRTYVSVCKSVWFSSSPLWRVIRRGSAVRWMCNCISRSFSFFPSSPSRHLVFSVPAALFRALAPLIAAGGTGLHAQDLSEAFQLFELAILAEVLRKYANLNGERVTVHASNTRYRIHRRIILAAPAVCPLDPGYLLFFSVNHFF